ncbi:MAG: SIR2 family protein [Candidatus Helarchaeota archaeon]
MVTVFLFGAGASFGAKAVDPFPPPLGKDLYKELVKWNKDRWDSIPIEVKNRFNSSDNFEDGMEVILSKYDDWIQDLWRDLACFFARYKISAQREDSYSRLIDALVEINKIKTTIFSTINYDCLLEQALKLRNNLVNYLLDIQEVSRNYMLEFSQKKVNVIKLHGSCNFVPDERMMSGMKQYVRFRTAAKFNPIIKSIENDQVPTYCSGNNPLYPAMVIYTREKIAQIGGRLLERLQKLWASVIYRAETVVVIGVYPNTEDNYIWNPLASTTAKLLYIGKEEVFNKWRSENRGSRPSKFLNSHFEDSIYEIIQNIRNPEFR